MGAKARGGLTEGGMEAPSGVVMTPVYLERREPARNRQRFYAITVTRTLSSVSYADLNHYLSSRGC